MEMSLVLFAIVGLEGHEIMIFGVSLFVFEITIMK